MAISPYKVHHLHLYEDGFGNTISSRKPDILKHSFSFFVPSKEHSAYGYYAFKKYPTTYHIAFSEDIKSDSDFKKFNRFFKNATVIQPDFNQIYTSLSQEDKTLLSKILNIDRLYYKKLYLTSQKPSAFLLTPRPMNLFEIKAQTESILKILKDDRYFWILKPHPNKESLKIITEIKKTYPNIPVVTNTHPVEGFLLTDTLPDYIAGFSSSTFLTLNPALFLYYIERINDEYLPFLLKTKKIKKEQLIPLEFQNSFRLTSSKWKKTKTLIKTYSHSNLLFLIDDNEYAHMISFQDNILKIKYPNKKRETFICDNNKNCTLQNN